MYFRHGFKGFTKNDYFGFAGAMKLINGQEPKIFHVETKDDEYVTILVSGTGVDETIVSMETTLGSYSIVLPGCSRVHSCIADAIVDEFDDYETTKEAIDSIASDFGMMKL